MTRKDFQLLAETLKGAQGKEGGRVAHERYVGQMAAVLKAKHPRFNILKFLQAAGVNVS